MKSALTLLEILIVLAVLLLGAALLFPAFFRPRPPGGDRFNCQSNLKQIGLGFLQYAQDYEERFPPARPTPATGWADAIYPYLRSQSIFQCPVASNPVSGFTSDYFYNRQLARVSQQKLNEVAFTILSGDGPDNAPTWSSLTQLPSDALKNTASPAQRHPYGGRGANYGFADGHVKWFPPNKISNTPLKPEIYVPTFTVR